MLISICLYIRIYVFPYLYSLNYVNYDYGAHSFFIINIEELPDINILAVRIAAVHQLVFHA